MLFEATDDDVLAVYQTLKDRYDLTLTNTTAVDDGFTIDCPIIVGNAHGQILWLYSDGDTFVLDVMNESKTHGTHWHPEDVEDAVRDLTAFMEGKSDYKLISF